MCIKDSAKLRDSRLNDYVRVDVWRRAWQQRNNPINEGSLCRCQQERTAEGLENWIQRPLLAQAAHGNGFLTQYNGSHGRQVLEL